MERRNTSKVENKVVTMTGNSSLQKKYINIYDEEDEEHVGELYGCLWGGWDAPHQTREADLKKKKKCPLISLQKRHCGNCIILYLFHLIFKILFFFQVLYILTLKIIIDMHQV